MNSSQNDQPVDIAADDRERASEVIASLRGIHGVSVRIERLLSGDYLADRILLFERKTLQDTDRERGKKFTETKLRVWAP